MRALALAALLLLSARAEAGTFQRWLKNIMSGGGRSVSAALTTADCDGAAQSLNDGTSITWTRASSATCVKNDLTITTVTSGQPRCAQYGCRVEASATNVTQRSEEFNHAYWSNQGLTFTADNTTAPDGTATADRINVSAGSSNKFLFASWAATAPFNSVVTQSVYAKPGTVNFIRLARTGSWQYVVFNVALGTITAYSPDGSGTNASRVVPTAGVVTMANGWYRIWAQFRIEIANQGEFQVAIGTTSAQLATAGGSVPAFNGAGTETLYVWGAQSEVGSLYASSYIATTSASVVRSADNASFAAPSWLSDTQGCMAATARATDVAAGVRALSFASGGSLYLQSTTVARANDGTNDVSATTTDVSGRSVPLRSSWYAATLTMRADAVAASGTYDGALKGATVHLGSTAGTSNFLNGHVSNVKLGSAQGGCQ